MQTLPGLAWPGLAQRRPLQRSQARSTGTPLLAAFTVALAYSGQRLKQKVLWAVRLPTHVPQLLSPAGVHPDTQQCHIRKKQCGRGLNEWWPVISARGTQLRLMPALGVLRMKFSPGTAASRSQAELPSA